MDVRAGMDMRPILRMSHLSCFLSRQLAPPGARSVEGLRPLHCPFWGQRDWSDLACEPASNPERRLHAGRRR